MISLLSQSVVRAQQADRLRRTAVEPLLRAAHGEAERAHRLQVERVRASVLLAPRAHPDAREA